MPSTHMQTRFGHILQRKYKFIAFFLLLLLLLTSCSREELEVVNLQANVQTQVYPAENSMMQELILSFAIQGEPSQKQIYLVASNQVSSWTLTIEGDEKDTYTVGPLSMGRNVMLPEGEWKLSILNDDGQTLEETFLVSYTMPKDIVGYDAETYTLHLHEGLGQLSLYDADEALLETRQIQQNEPITLQEGVSKASVLVQDQTVRYIVYR